jgi:DNA-binding response OmpR family regulator
MSAVRVPTSPRARGAQPLRVLVVEDDRDIAHLLHTLFAARGYRTEVVHDGGDAVTAFAALAPDLVTLDVGVPTVDGEELCRRFRAASDAYLLMLSARTDEQLIRRCLAHGADAYLRKPFSTRDLHSRIEAMMTRRRGS